MRWVLLIGLVLATASLAFVLDSDSPGANPQHENIPELTLDGSDTPAGEFNRPCGLAFDRDGNLYVASAGSSAIDIFDPDREYLATIHNPNRPCDVEVDSKGRVYVLETAGKRVVRYTPNSNDNRPPSTYSEPMTIGASGYVRGIAVDPYDDRLYVAKHAATYSYDSSGQEGANEVQRILVEAEGGAFRLGLEGERTDPIPFDASHAEVDAALERLSFVEPGDVEVSAGRERGHYVTFTSGLASTDVDDLAIDPSGLRGRDTGSYFESVVDGFRGRTGSEDLREAIGVGVYVYPGEAHTRYVFAADGADDKGDTIEIFSGNDVSELRHRMNIDGSEASEEHLDFGRSASLGVDPGNGHFYVLNASSSSIDEFEATGSYVGSIETDIENGTASAIAVGRSGGSDDGTIYVTNGEGERGEVLAFSPLAPPSREQFYDLPSVALDETCGVDVDSYGNIYVSHKGGIDVRAPDGEKLVEIPNQNTPCELAVDSKGNLYASDKGTLTEGDEKVELYRPDSFPPTTETSYGQPEVILRQDAQRWRIVVNPISDRLLASRDEYRFAEYGSAVEGSQLVRDDIGEGLLSGIEQYNRGLDICAKTGNIYATGRGVDGWRIYVLDEAGSERVTTIDGTGSPRGSFELNSEAVAVDDANCHVFINIYGRGIEEYETSGAFVAAYTPRFPRNRRDIGVDSSQASPNRGNVYVVSPEGLSVFGPRVFDMVP